MPLTVRQIAESNKVPFEVFFRALTKIDPKCLSGDYVPGLIDSGRALRAVGITIKDMVITDAPFDKHQLPVWCLDTAPFNKEWKDPHFHLWCHKDVLKIFKDASRFSLQVLQRCSLVLTHLASLGKTGVVKATQGSANRGWLRTPLGGGDGCHFYLWWSRQGSSISDGLYFPRDSVLVREVRIHDNHTPLSPGNRNDYHELKPADLVGGDLTTVPWTKEQLKFAWGDAPVRILCGGPGAGKTSTLWHSIGVRGQEKVLYVTWSEILSDAARDHFKTFSSPNTTVECRSFHQFLLAISKRKISNPLGLSVEEGRKTFLKRLERLSPTIKGPWRFSGEGLYEEVRAYLLGGKDPFTPPWAVPLFLAAENGYKECRQPFIGSEAVTSALNITRIFHDDGLLPNFFPDLELAWVAACNLKLDHKPEPPYDQFDRLVVDEVQDLTIVEFGTLILLARRVAEISQSPMPFLLLAGDEFQNVRPSGFGWNRYKQFLTRHLTQPTETFLRTSIRCPRRVVALISHLRQFYTLFDKDQPKFIPDLESEFDNHGVIIHCRVSDGVMQNLLNEFIGNRNTIVMALTYDDLMRLPAQLRNSFVIPEQVKGIESQVVCLINPGAHLKLLSKHKSNELDLPDPSFIRRLIDSFRVALGRSTEAVIFIDSDNDEAACQASIDFLEPVSPNELKDEDIISILRDSAEEIEKYDRASSCIRDSEATLDMDPYLSLRRAKQALGILEVVEITSGEINSELFRKANYCLLNAIFRFLRTEKAAPASVNFLLSDSRKCAAHLGDTKLRCLIDLVLNLLKTSSPNSVDQWIDLMAEVESGWEGWGGHLQEGIRYILYPWVPSLRSLASVPSAAEQIFPFLPSWYSMLGVDLGISRQWLKDSRMEVIQKIEQGQGSEEVFRLATVLGADKEEVASCLEVVGFYEEAARIFESFNHSDGLRHAFRNYRKAGDITEALRLASLVAPDSSPILENVARLLQGIKGIGQEIVSQLTPAERVKVLGSLKDIVARLEKQNE